MINNTTRSCFIALCSSAIVTTFFLQAYVSVPRSNADTTERMNGGGDPEERPGLRDGQRSAEYLDDWWGRNDYYYSEYGVHQNHTLKNNAYNTESPPYYPWPNTTYNDDSSVHYYNNNARYYRPNYAR